MRGKLIRRIGYAVLVVGLVVGFVLYQKSKTGTPAASEPVPAKTVHVKWADGSEFTTIEPGGAPSLAPERKLIWEQARRELNTLGISEQDQASGGYTIELTVDRTAQTQAENAIVQIMDGQPDNLREALVAIDPATGAIIAYSGYNKENPGIDYAVGWFSPGSLYMPFDLVALLHAGKGLGETYDGHSPREFGSATIRNSPKATCATCTVAEAMKQSINTVFVDVAFNTVGTRAVGRAAIEAGIPATVGARNFPLTGTTGSPPSVNIALGGDVYQVRVADIAGAYATFAADGVRHTAHLVRAVDDASGFPVYDAKAQYPGKNAFNAEDAQNNRKIARNVTESLLPIPAYAQIPCAESRPCAGKTGTHECVNSTPAPADCEAWMAGYTPEISTAVLVTTDTREALRTKDGAAVEGSGLPGRIWQNFMNTHLSGRPVQQFSPFEPIGK